MFQTHLDWPWYEGPVLIVLWMEVLICGSEPVLPAAFSKSNCSFQKYHTCLSIMKSLPSVQRQWFNSSFSVYHPTNLPHNWSVNQLGVWKTFTLATQPPWTFISNLTSFLANQLFCAINLLISWHSYPLLSNHYLCSQFVYCDCCWIHLLPSFSDSHGHLPLLPRHAATLSRCTLPATCLISLPLGSASSSWSS